MNLRLVVCVFSAILAAGGLGVDSVSAQDFKPKEAGDFLIRARGLAVIPNEDGDLSVVGAGIPGETAVDNAFVPEVDVSYFITDNLALELIAAVTTHGVKAEGTPLGDVDLGEVGLIPPTLSLQYHFLPRKRLSPYVGAGLNYTVFYVDELGDASDINYESGFGFALQAGIDYAITGRWSLNADVKRLFLNTDADIRIGDATNIEADVDIDPWIIGVGVGYRF